MPIASLRAFLPSLPWDVQPLARLYEDGRLEPEGPAWPAEGRTLLVLWAPGEAPAFRLAFATVRRVRGGWRAWGAGAAGWVVLWVPVCDLVPLAGVFEAGGGEPPA